MTARTIAKSHRTTPALVMAILSALTLTLFMGSVLVGPSTLSLPDVLGALLSDEQNATGMIVREIRLPRAILGTAIGATLGLSGAALQGFLRNPLAEPGLIGVSASAALGAVMTFYTGLAAWFALALPLGGMAGACIAVIIVQFLAGRGGGSLSLILAGIAVSSFAAALTSLALNLAPNPFAALEIMFWLMGSLADRSFEHVWLALPFMALGWLMLLSTARPLNALTLGEDTATTLGINMASLRLKIVLGSAICVGAATSVAGAIGFIGLVVPHILRPLVAHKPGVLLPASMLGGAALTLAADITVRLVSPERELKLGVLTALVGAPFFLILILRHRRKML